MIAVPPFAPLQLAVEPLLTHDHAAIWDRLGLGRAEAQGAMWPGPVVMVEVLAQDLDQVAEGRQKSIVVRRLVCRHGATR